MDRAGTHRRRRTAAVVAGVVAIIAVTAACVAPVPPGAQRVSPADGTGYIDPTISGDGTTVLSRREADRNAGYDAARDLVVTRLASNTTTVVPGVRTVLAVSRHGRTVVHGISETKVSDTTTGVTTPLRSGPTTTFGAAAVSADGSTVAVNEVRYRNGNCPCELWLLVWRNGVRVREQLIDANSLTTADQYRNSFVSLDAAGSAAFLHRYATRQVVRLDVASGAITPLDVQFPEITDISPFPDLATYLRWKEWVDFGSTDASAFRLNQGDAAYLVRSGRDPIELPTHGSADPAPSISPSASHIAYIERTSTLPGQERRSYRVRDLTTGVSWEVVACDAGSAPASEPSCTFNGWGSVADSGRATFGQWAAPLSGPWPPSIVYVKG